ncbi:MAG: glycosyltransferase family 39 protein [Anaerolineae bacterium]|nr:glycosyltransferase family 39 protein [Anaerolineae bacterium]
MKSRDTTLRWFLLAVAIILVASWLRFHWLAAQSFWNDEGNSARLSERSLRLILEGTASDVHPPLYYLLLRGWRELVGESEFGLRSLSAFAGVVTVAGAWALVRLGGWQRGWTERRVVAVAALLVAVSPALVYYSQEARMYALLACLAALATVALLVWLRSGDWRAAGGYVVLLTAGLYTHYFFPIVIVLNALIVAWWLWAHWRGHVAVAEPHAGVAVWTPLRSTRAFLLVWLGMVALALLLYSPWLPIAWRQTGGGEQGVALGEFMVDFGRFLIVGATLAEPLIVSAALLSILLGVLAGKRAISRFLGYGLIGVVVPLAAMALSGATLPQFYKFGLLIIVPLTALIAYGWRAAWVWPHSGRLLLRLLTVLLVIAVGWGAARSLDNMYNDAAYARADYRGLAGRIAAENYPNAGIVLNAPNQWEVFTYYHRDGAPVYPLPRGNPNPVTIEQELRGIVTMHDRLYVLYWGEHQRDPDGLVEKWLNANTFPVSSEWVGDVRFVVYAVPNSAETTLETRLDLPFGDAIMLNGYTLLSADTLHPGDIVELTLYWSAVDAVDERYKVFVHLQEIGGRPVAQRDQEPLAGVAPTDSWHAGDVIIDNYGVPVPLDLEPGAYRLVVGMYDIADPTRRVPIAGPDGTVGAWELATIVVEESD